MSFLSLAFPVFCLLTIGVYYIVPRKMQPFVLLLANYIFYTWTNPFYLFFILFTTVNTFITARQIGKLNEKLSLCKKSVEKPRPRRIKKLEKQKRKLLVGTILLNFGILVTLKYGADLVGIYNEIASSFWQVDPIELSFIVPLGISFYTFQTMSYIFDVNKGKHPPEEDILQFALFTSFFPQLVQGPISRYRDLSPQFKEYHAFNFRSISYGLQLVLWGLFKKMVIADRILAMTKTIFDDYQSYEGLYITLAMILYSVQVYADFSAGMDIACGVSECLGIKLADNFRRPFLAGTISNYWSRWHISLNDWLKDYVFVRFIFSPTSRKITQKMMKRFPNKFGRQFMTYMGTFVVRTVNAIWHGGSPKYFVNGLYNSAIMIFADTFSGAAPRLHALLKTRKESAGWKLFCILRTFMLISFGRLIVRANDVGQAIMMVRSMFTKFNPWIFFDGSLFELGVSQKEFYLLLIACMVFLCVSLAQEKGICIRDKIQEQGLLVRWSIYYAAIMTVILCGVYGIGYQAGGFIYMQF